MTKPFDRNDFVSRFTKQLPFIANSGQQKAMHGISDFIGSSVIRDVFILKGYAGTGKTNLVSALTKILPDFKWRTVLLAPTGRAAKVLTSYSQKPAQTIHKKIFKKTISEEGGVIFSLGENLHKNTVFIVDEASMIGIDNSNSKNMLFDSLLESLFEYVFSGTNCKLLLVGDSAQLPPVGSDESPDLNVDFLKATYHLDVLCFELNQVARQSLESGILANATSLRLLLDNNNKINTPKLILSKDVIKLSGEEMLDELNSSYSKYGYNDTLLVTRSNKRANLYNQAVRTRIRFMEDEICAGDLLMVVKNNYYWLDDSSASSATAGFIANGDTIEILKIIKRENIYAFNFLECVVKFTDYPTLPEMQVKLILESISAETSNLTQDQQKVLFENIMADMADEPIKAKRMAYLKKSQYYNALQVKFCYAVTCHKAQGGQWPVVFIDQGYVTKEQVDRNYIRWLYTAITRAQEKVYLINFSEEFF